MDDMEIFCKELADLCRKHNLWITRSTHANDPRLRAGYGDETGYSVRRIVWSDRRQTTFHLKVNSATEERMNKAPP